MKAVLKNVALPISLNWSLGKLNKKVKNLLYMSIESVENNLVLMFSGKIIKKMGPGHSEWEEVEKEKPFIGL
ncbi:MAG: hypothetical protein KDD58_02580 [Bdellovibrionales bacterium]|nr:hypothetical protein [Bdellovibrionales bacterium]